ncbi:hypothetical protein KIN20_007047 [Parelaphostrongylus tenuis]|uniref:Uncharacterized protein n=1 Tax=Parelaphostrongylus tenuis TaxID=148309 RepID=A0AAD5MKZ6_PARTN|nr:hypothetical protein KIN20_007047 [Parelaphostrongylus tenuis]
MAQTYQKRPLAVTSNGVPYGERDAKRAGIGLTMNINMANWWRDMWQSVVKRAV